MHRQFIWSVWFIWLVSFPNQTNQLNKPSKPDPRHAPGKVSAHFLFQRTKPCPADCAISGARVRVAPKNPGQPKRLANPMSDRSRRSYCGK